MDLQEGCKLHKGLSPLALSSISFHAAGMHSGGYGTTLHECPRIAGKSRKVTSPSGNIAGTGVAREERRAGKKNLKSQKNLLIKSFFLN
jgi:hypothetical protein